MTSIPASGPAEGVPAAQPLASAAAVTAAADDSERELGGLSDQESSQGDGDPPSRHDLDHSHSSPRWKKGQNLAQTKDSWNRALNRCVKRFRRLLFTFPQRRFVEAAEVTRKQMAQQQQEQQQQQQQASAEPNATNMTDRDGASSGTESETDDQHDFTPPLGFIVLQGPHGKQSAVISEHLQSLKVVHDAAVVMCSAVQHCAEQHRLTARVEAFDQGQAHLTQYGSDQQPRKRKAPSKQLRQEARALFAQHVEPKLTENDKAWLKGPHAANYLSCTFSSSFSECPAGEGCYQLRQKLSWPDAVPLVTPNKCPLNSAQNQLLIAWCRGTQPPCAAQSTEVELPGLR